MLFFNRKDRVKVKIFDYGDHFMAMASTKGCTVCNCFGTTHERAKEMALFRLKKTLNKVEEEKELVIKGEHYAIYRDK
jgi:hypothetical protein